ncbi:FLYWCH-type zinc finger-containing protein 1-like [Aedes albopictus]|uniref:FLYWCH-type domain-containing protein n=1 Tax=Aedes albopictus TaxID=7160 RepID=A0ABM1XSZ2_AEDAL
MGVFEPAVFGTTRRGQQKLIHNGHAYTKDRQSAKTCNWKCSLFTRYKCKARAVTRDINGVVYVKVTNTLHYHPVEQYKINYRRLAVNPMNDKAVFTERAQYEYTSRGTQRLLHGGYYFSKNKTNESSGRVNWKCQFYQRLRCKARAITKNINGYEYVRVTHEEHTHRKDLTEDEFLKLKIVQYSTRKSEEHYDNDDEDDGEDDEAKTQFPLDLKMVVGRKGRPMLLMGGHAFFRNNTHKSKTYWLCAKSRSLKCRARIITLDGSAGLILKNQVHNHPAALERS